MFSNRPHGGRLINRLVEGAAREQLLELAERLPKVQLNARQLSDCELIGIGAFSPLEGFMNQRDYESVLHDQRLANRLPWTMPVTLAVDEESAQRAAKSA